MQRIKNKFPNASKYLTLHVTEYRSLITEVIKNLQSILSKKY